MQVTQAASSIKSSQGLRDTATATIKANAHAFKMLSSGLYSNKIAAVLREIGCNAADAHIEAGTPDLPIEVKLPTKINEQFYIKDWGPGLSHEQMVGSPGNPGLYLNYFDSTKQNTNAQTGAFGLGCKSPFSYTDSFTVTSCHAGIKRLYSVYVGEAGLPTISLMDEAPVSQEWPHGVSVGFPVAYTDMHTFNEEAQHIFEWFRITPRILGGTTVRPIQFLYVTNEFATYKSDNYYAKPYVLMGNVRYELNPNSLGLDTIGNQILNSTNLVIKASIGSVQVTPSRESLQYDHQTIKYLKEAISSAGKALITELDVRTKKVLTGGWTAACNFDKEVDDLFSRSTGYLGQLCRHYGVEDKYGELYSSGHYFSFKTAVDFEVRHSHSKNRRDGSVIVHSNYWSRDPKQQKYIELNPKSVIAYGNPIKVKEKIRIAVRDKEYDQLYWTESKTNAETLSTQLFNMPLLDIATLPEPPKIVRTKKGQKRAILAMTVSIEKLDGTKQDLDPQIVNANCQYFLIDRSYMTWGNKHENYEFAGQDMDGYTWYKLRSAFYNYHPDCPIDGFTKIKKKEEKRFIDAGWKELGASMKEWIKSSVVQNKITAMTKSWSPTVELPNNFPGKNIEILCWIKDKYPLIELPVALKPIVDKVYNASADGANKAIPKAIEKYNDLAEKLGVTREGLKGTTIEQLETSLNQKHPGLSFMNYNAWKHVLDKNPNSFQPLMSTLMEIK